MKDKKPFYNLAKTSLYFWDLVIILAMPTIMNQKGYRFFFYSNDHLPKHIHVEKAEKTAKFNLEPVELVTSKKFSASELREIRILIQNNNDLLINSWNEYFN